MENNDSFGAAFGRLVKRKRAERRITQGQLVEQLFPNIEDAAHSRKGDISKLENGKTANPHSTTIKKIADILDITAEAIDQLQREAQTPPAQKLDHLNTLSRDALELLASRFEIEQPHRLTDGELQGMLTQKAEDYRTYRAEIEAIDEHTKGLGNLKAAAQDAAERLDFEEVENLLAMVDATETAITAQGKELRARNALLRGKAEQAFTILSAAADSFASLDPLLPSEKRNIYCSILYHHGVRYGGSALTFAIEMLQNALNVLIREDALDLWAQLNNNLANALAIQGSNSRGRKGTDFLNQSIISYQNTLTVFSKDHEPNSWATTLMNFANTLSSLAERSQSSDGYSLLTQAFELYHDALGILTKDEHPRQWATIKNNMGSALRKISRYSQVYSEALVLEQAVTLIRESLTVRTTEAYPDDSALTLNNLGNALCDQARYEGGRVGAELFNQAIFEYHESLKIRTKTQNPLGWAMTTTNLATAFKELAQLNIGEIRDELLAKAVLSYQDALSVFSQDSHSIQWARINVNLALVETSRFQSIDSINYNNPAQHLEAALAYIDGALEEFDPIHMPQDHSKAMALREDILKALTAYD